MTIIDFNERLNERRLPILAENKRYNHESAITCPADLADLCADTIGLRNATEEYFYLLAFDTKLRLIGVSEIAHGSKASCYVDMKIVFERALMLGATAIAVCHNHPSGDCTPSADDREITDRLKKCADILNIGFTDHIIVGDSYYSFTESEV